MEIQANWAQIQRKVNNAEWGQAGNIVQMYANRFECSTDKIYYELRNRFGKKKRIDREYKVDPDNRLVRMIFDLKLMGEMMHLQRREVSTKWCIDELIRQGYDEARKLTVSTVNRRLNDMGYREKQPNMRIESAYANQVHMIDFSRSKYFQLFDYDARQDDYMLTVSGKELHYKQDDSRLRTWIVQYMDDYSRLRKVKAYAETNESSFLGLDHLSWSWLAGEEDEHKMRYLPAEMLRSDNGSFRKAQETQTAMRSMQINLTKQRPGHKGGTAKVENRFKSLWQEFELPLAIRLGEGGRIWMKEYNDLLHEFCIKEHTKAHPVHRQYSKGEWYQQSLADRSVTHRTTDVDVIRLACRVEKRKVDDHLRISLNNEYYRVPQYVEGIPTTGKQIYVHENKYGELTGKMIDDLATATFELEAWSASQWGKFESYKLTPKRLREEDFEREQPSYNEIVGSPTHEASETESEEAIPLNPPSKTGSNVRYMEPDTEDVQADSVFNERIEATGRVFRSELDAREYIGVRMEAWGLGYNDVSGYFEDLFNAMPVTQRDIDAIINDKIQNDFDSGDLAITA